VNRIVYLDHAATTPMRTEVLQAMVPYFIDRFGNASSSLYALGRASREAVEAARRQVAELIGAKPAEIYFTSGGSEADNWAVKGIFAARKGDSAHVITTAIEHHALLHACDSIGKMGAEITQVPVDSTGTADPADIRKAIRPDTILISVMHANNEVGTIQPIAEIGAIAEEAGVPFHVDAVQTVGHYPVNVEEMHCSLLSLSGHKLYGPKGVGAMFLRKGTRIRNLIDGGGQESSLRAGTENVPGIVGLGKAAELAGAELEESIRHESGLRDRLRKAIEESVPDVNLNGHPDMRLPNNLNMSFAGVEGEGILLRLDYAGVCVSTGSACTTGSLDPSHVLMAMGLKHEQAHGSVRFTFGKDNSKADVDYVAGVLADTVRKLRDISPTYVPGNV